MTSPRDSDPVGGPIILCYDGSQEAAEAIACTGALLPGARPLVVTVWNRSPRRGCLRRPSRRQATPPRSTRISDAQRGSWPTSARRTAILPGHLADALADHASVPLLVVPSHTAAEERRRQLRDKHGLRHRIDPGVVPAAAAATRRALHSR
jgi:hypothetical protein